jgi:hypothetical protein
MSSGSLPNGGSDVRAKFREVVRNAAEERSHRLSSSRALRHIYTTPDASGGEHSEAFDTPLESITQGITGLLIQPQSVHDRANVASSNTGVDIPPFKK